MTWDTADTTATIGGPAAASVSGTVSYEDGGQTLVVDVTTDFVAGDQITISDLSYLDFTAVSAADNLELEINNDDVVQVTDDKTITIIDAYGISSAANQIFIEGDPITLISTITITDSAQVPTFTALNDLRIRIPAGFNMSWDITSYEDGGQTLVLDVTADFAAGDQITVADLGFTGFTDTSPADNLELEINDDDVVSATDDKTITVQEQLTLAKRAFFSDGTPVPDGSTLPAGITVKFMIYLNNRWSLRTDVNGHSQGQQQHGRLCVRALHHGGGNDDLQRRRRRGGQDRCRGQRRSKHHRYHGRCGRSICGECRRGYCGRLRMGTADSGDHTISVSPIDARVAAHDRSHNDQPGLRRRSKCMVPAKTAALPLPTG